MKKIPTIFKRDANFRAIDVPNPDCAWVFAGEGVATRKYDGTAVMLRDGRLFVRYDAKTGRTPPPAFEPCEPAPDEDGHWPGWVPAGLEDKRLYEAIGNMPYTVDGTYELIGPKVNGNPEAAPVHGLVPHANATQYPDCPRDFEGIREFLGMHDIEGIVWHHPDGRMAKIKQRDFGLKRREQP